MSTKRCFVWIVGIGRLNNILSHLDDREDERETIKLAPVSSGRFGIGIDLADVCRGLPLVVQIQYGCPEFSVNHKSLVAIGAQ